MKVGDRAPNFEARDENGTSIRLSDFANRQVVLMFYPADNTPGCTKQLCSARDDYDRYLAAGIAVFGVNPGSASTHKKFSDSNKMRTPLLVDDGARICRAYDALMPIPILSVVNRTVVGIDAGGVVRFYERGMPATSEILAALASP